MADLYGGILTVPINAPPAAADSMGAQPIGITPGTSPLRTSLIILQEAAAGFSGIFGYSPTVGAGNLIFSIAAVAGTDPYGNPYPAGLMTTSGSSTIEGSDYVINTAGAFWYSAAPALGDLLISLAGSAGTDAYGNAYPAGLRMYNLVGTMPALINGWSSGSFQKYTQDALGNLVVSFKDLVPGTTADGTKLWGAGAIPSYLQPATDRRVVAYCNGLQNNGSSMAESAALEFLTDGSVECFGVDASASRVDLFATIPVMF